MSRSLQGWMLLLAALLLGCESGSAPPTQPPPRVVVADPTPSPPVEPFVPPPAPTPLPPPQTYTRPEEAAVQALAETPVEELIGLLANPAQRDAASRAAILRGGVVVAPLVAALENEDPQVRAAAAFTLGQLGGEAKSAVTPLQQQARGDQNEIARDAAAFALDAIEGKSP